MASLYLAEYRAVSVVDGQIVGAAEEPPIAEQKLAIGTETKSAAFNADTRFIRIHVDAICSILIGSSPTADATNQRLASDHTEYKGVTPGHKLSVITNT